MMGAREESIWIGKVANYQLTKYRYFGPITYEAITDFIKKWRLNELTVVHKSEPIPDVQPIKSFANKIVADNYVEEVFNNDKFVLVLYHERWTKSFDDYLKKFWIAFADKMELNKQHLKIAYIDCDENDVPIHQIQ